VPTEAIAAPAINPIKILMFIVEEHGGRSYENKDAAAFSALCIYERIARQMRFRKPKR
jgi:hypothetical protein